MRRQMTRVMVAALAAGWLLFPTLFGQENAKPEKFSAVWAVAVAEADAKNVPVDIQINRYNSEADMQKFGELLKAKGGETLRMELEKEDVGFLSSPTRTRVPIALARKQTEGKKTIVRMLVARHLWFIEFKFSGKSEDYPFMIVQLDLDANGKGTGTAIAAAKIKFDKEANAYQVKSLDKGKGVNTLRDVQALK